MRLFKVILRPIITEKTSMMSGKTARYGFEVDGSATKIDIKMAVKELYGVEVAAVNILNTREKFKYGRKRNMQIKRRSTKKAYVTLKKAGDTIDVTLVK